MALTVNRHRSGKAYNAVPLPPGAEYLGTVIRNGTDAGALVRLANGHLVQMNHGVIRSLSQREVLEALAAGTVRPAPKEAT